MTHEIDPNDARTALAQKIDAVVRGHNREDVMGALFAVACAVIHSGGNGGGLLEAHRKLDFYSMAAKWELLPHYFPEGSALVAHPEGEPAPKAEMDTTPE